MATRIREHNYHRWQTDYKTYDVSFYNDSISTTVTSSSVKVSEWISIAKPFPFHRLIVGLDAEWLPSSFREQNPIATLQLFVGSRCLIYQIIHSLYFPQSLADFLFDTSNIFAGVGVKQDLDKLQNEYGIGGNARYEDLQSLAARVHYRSDFKNVGLKRLAMEVLGKEMDKPKDVTTILWDNWSLTADQVQYACLDAFVSYQIGAVLMNASL